jgi:hypothetical protein
MTSLVVTLKAFINTYEIKAKNGWPKGAKSKYNRKNKELKSLWDGVVDQIEKKCNIKSNGTPYTLSPAKGALFPSLDSNRAILYIYHEAAYRDYPPRQRKSGKRGVYCALFFNTDPKRNFEFRLSLTQGRADLEQAIGDKEEAKEELKIKAKVIAKLFNDKLMSIGFSTANNVVQSGVEIASKEYIKGEVFTEKTIIKDITNLLKVYEYSVGIDKKSLHERVRVEVNKRNQAAFQRKIHKQYKECRITGSKLKKILEAAHIVPHCDSADDSIDNGMLLRSDIHKLYDKFLLGISEKGILSISNELKNTEYEYLEGLQLKGLRPNKNVALNLSKTYSKFLSKN